MSAPSPQSPAENAQVASSWQHDCELARVRSEQRAWYVARVSLLTTGLALLSLAALVPLKSAVPYIVYVDKLTGEAQVLSVLDRRVASANAVQDKHWVTEYVRARERYVPPLLQMDYDSVLGQSAQSVAHAYARLYEGADALDKRLGAHTEMAVEVLSVTLPPAEPGKAVVRFERVTRRDNDQTELARARFIATLAYEYRPAQFVREAQLIENPLGFQVIAYTVDAELTQDPHRGVSPSNPNHADPR